MRTYVAEAGLSPTRTAARPGVTPRAASARSSPSSSPRIARPTAVPSMSLAGKVHRAGLADDDDLDLSRVLQLALDLARDQVGELAGLAVELSDLIARKIERELQYPGDRKSTRLNSSHLGISYAVFCLKKKKKASI